MTVGTAVKEYKPTMRDESTREAILAEIRQNGGNKKLACEKYRVTPATFNDYGRRHPDFGDKTAQAIQHGHAYHAQSLDDYVKIGERYLANLLERANIDPETLKVKDILEIVKMLRGDAADAKTKNQTLIQNFNFDNLDAKDLKQMLAIKAKMKQEAAEAVTDATS